jgi:hypothetical protein
MGWNTSGDMIGPEGRAARYQTLYLRQNLLGSPNKLALSRNSSLNFDVPGSENVDARDTQFTGSVQSPNECGRNTATANEAWLTVGPQ